MKLYVRVPAGTQLKVGDKLAQPQFGLWSPWSPESGEEPYGHVIDATPGIIRPDGSFNVRCEATGMRRTPYVRS